MELSLAEMRGRGYYCEITEHDIKHGGLWYKNDLFHFADIICLRKDDITVVQTTTRGNMNARVRKITDAETVGHVRVAGIRILVHGWMKSKRTGKWILTEVDMS